MYNSDSLGLSKVKRRLQPHAVKTNENYASDADKRLLYLRSFSVFTEGSVIRITRRFQDWTSDAF